jgi:hypothetical protein
LVTLETVAAEDASLFVAVALVSVEPLAAVEPATLSDVAVALPEVAVASALEAV